MGCLVLLVLLGASVGAETITLYVAPDGNDAWSGRLAEPRADGTDGPLATITAARDAIRRLRAGPPSGPPLPTGEENAPAPAFVVLVRGGTYRMTAPFVLEPQDSGSADAPVLYAAYPGEKPILSGGVVVTGWHKGPGELWTADVSGTLANGGGFNQLFVNGERRPRARTPNEGWFTTVGKAPPAVEPGTGRETPRDRTAFIFRPGDIKAWPNPSDVNVVVYHSWETSRLRVAGVDEQQHIVSFTGPACWPFEDWGPNQRYFVENAPDSLDAPGEWYLDTQTGLLSYWPMPGEDMGTAEVVVPRLRRLLELRGDAEVGLYVESVILRGLSFQHQDWALEPQGHSDPQAAVTIPAAVMADGAVNCALERCEVAHVGEYAIWLRRGCRGNRIVQCRIHDMGVGGIRIGEATMAAEDAAESSGNLVDNNHIYDGGHVYPAGVGVWVAQSSKNVISHNEIHDLNYSGMSIGWNWGDEPNRCHHNIIEYNHVHHVMRGQLSDGGAIYTLGVSPGSVIRNNVFHDVWPYQSPPIGWGIYLDATCSQYLVERNVVYNTLSGGLMYNNGGHEHVIQNNIFAFSANQMLWPYWERRPSSFRRNIIYFTQGSLFVRFAATSLHERLRRGEPLGEWDYNLYWLAPPAETGPVASREQSEAAELLFFDHTFAEWQALGLDTHSLIADPQFENAAAYDFRLKPTSPAFGLGFEQIDTSQVGLYGDPEWVAQARAVVHPPTVLPPAPPPPQPTPVDDGFEDTAVGAPPAHAVVSGEGRGASIRVTAEQAATGRHSLKFTDVAGLEVSWQPHMFYQPHFTRGVIRESFDIRLGPDATVFTEWRDNTAYPDCVGPSVTFDSAGNVIASGRRLTAIPLSEWVHVEIECEVGKKGSGVYSVVLTVPGGTPQRFGDIPVTGNAFHAVHWLGFVSNATVPAACYLDNVQIAPVQR